LVFYNLVICILLLYSEFLTFCLSIDVFYLSGEIKVLTYYYFNDHKIRLLMVLMVALMLQCCVGLRLSSRSVSLSSVTYVEAYCG